jgi:hypothetical protein
MELATQETPSGKPGSAYLPGFLLRARVARRVPDGGPQRLCCSLASAHRVPICLRGKET